MIGAQKKISHRCIVPIRHIITIVISMQALSLCICISGVWGRSKEKERELAVAQHFAVDVYTRKHFSPGML